MPFDRKLLFTDDILKTLTLFQHFTILPLWVISLSDCFVLRVMQSRAIVRKFGTLPSLLVNITLCLILLWKNKFIPQCNPSQIKVIFYLLRTICPFPGTSVSSPLILWGCQHVKLLFQSLLCLLPHQYVIPCCRQHTTLFFITCI